MNKDDTAAILRNIVNSVVVHTPGRSYPGIVVQGDQLRKSLRIAERIRINCQRMNFDALADDVEDLYDFLHEKTFIYQSVLEDLKLQLPFSDRVSPPPHIALEDSDRGMDSTS